MPLPPPPKTIDPEWDRYFRLVYPLLNPPAGSPAPVVTATYIIGQYDRYVTHNFAGVVTDTLPDPAGSANREIVIRTWTANAVNSATPNVIGPTGGAAGTAILTGTAGKWARLTPNSAGTAWQVVENN